MKRKLLLIGKGILIFYMAGVSIYFAYLQFTRDDEDGVEMYGAEAFNVKRNMNAAGIVFVNIGKAFTWPYFIFRDSDNKINYAVLSEKMVQNYFEIIYFPQADSTQKKMMIKTFMSGNQSKDIQDSIKQKCILISNLTIAAFEDLKYFCSFNSNDSIFSFSANTDHLHDQLANNFRESQLADSITYPLIRVMNNKNSQMYAFVRVAKGFADETGLAKIANGLTQMQTKVRHTFKDIFSEDLK